MATQDCENEQETDLVPCPDRLTRHAATQIEKRCIRTELLDYLVEYGRCEPRCSRQAARRDPRGPWRTSVESYSFTGKTWARFANDHPELAKQHPRYRDVYAVVSAGCVITAAYCPAPRHQRRR